MYCKISLFLRKSEMRANGKTAKSNVAVAEKKGNPVN